MTAAQRVDLADEVQRFVVEHEDIDEAFAVLETATDYAIEHGRPMSLAEALKTIHAVARQIEALG